MTAPSGRRVIGVPSRSPGHDDDVREAVRALVADMQVLRARVETLERQARRHDDGDHELVATLAARIGLGVAFSAADLIAHAGIDSELAAALGGIGARRLGHRLRALAGRQYGEVTIALVTREAGGRVWQLVPSGAR